MNKPCVAGLPGQWDDDRTSGVARRPVAPRGRDHQSRGERVAERLRPLDLRSCQDNGLVGKGRAVEVDPQFDPADTACPTCMENGSGVAGEVICPRLQQALSRLEDGRIVYGVMPASGSNAQGDAGEGYGAEAARGEAHPWQCVGCVERC